VEPVAIVSTWIKLHDNFWRNPKILAAGEDAGTLYIQGLCYCSDGLTDGLIPTAALRMLTARKDAKTLARILVREGLWVETAQGWEVHDYLVHQRSRLQVEAERQKARDRKARSRSGHAVTPPVTDGGSHAGSHAHVTQPETDTETDNPTPTPPPLETVTELKDHPMRGFIHPDAYQGGRLDRIDPAQVEELRAVRASLRGKK